MLRPSVNRNINPHAPTPPVSPWTLHAGSIITGLNSDLPGW
jgi:hypothetical protein